MMKSESGKKFSWIGKWQKVASVFGVLVGCYVFIFPWLIIAALENRYFGNKILSSPEWITKLLWALVYPLAFLSNSLAFYRAYIDWIAEVLAA